MFPSRFRYEAPHSLDEAISLLREGMKIISPTQGVFSLYQAAAEILARDGKADEAISLLSAGAEVIGHKYGGYKLIESAILFASDLGRLSMVANLEKDAAQARLLEITSLISSENFGAAVAIAEKTQQEFPRYFPPFAQGAFAALSNGDPDRARAQMQRFGGPPDLDKGSSPTWLMAAIEFVAGSW